MDIAYHQQLRFNGFLKKKQTNFWFYTIKSPWNCTQDALCSSQYSEQP